MPKLRLPSPRLYGKSGAEIDVTAMVDLKFALDGLDVTVPVFVQPESEPDCLLGMNSVRC